MEKNELYPVVLVKCVGCGQERIIKAGEAVYGEHPVCTVCFMPMIAKKAIGKK